MDNIKKQGEEELKRALLMMKYDNRKTLTENLDKVKLMSEEIPAYPAPKEDPIVSTTQESSIKNSQEYAENSSETIDTSLGLKQIPQGFSEDSFDTIKNEVTGDEGLVDALDLGIGWNSPRDLSLSSNDTILISQFINGAKGRCFKNPYDSLYYPKIEGLRYLYNIDEDNETLYGEIKNPPGYNNTNIQLWSQKTMAEMVSRYQEWLDVMDDTQANVDDDGKPTGNQQPTPEPTPPPKPKNNPYRDIKLRKIYDDSQIER
jgi:hypothetical protein